MKKTATLSILVAALALFSACDKQERNRIQWQQTMKNAAELGTVEYTVKKIVQCKDKQKYTIGDRQILFSSTAYLKAGVKLENFSEENVLINGKDVTVTLPHAELLSFNMPAEETQTVFENYGFFRGRFTAEEQTRYSNLAKMTYETMFPTWEYCAMQSRTQRMSLSPCSRKWVFRISTLNLWRIKQ